MHPPLSAGEIGCGPPAFEGASSTAGSCTASHLTCVCLGILLAKQTVVERGWLCFSLKMQLGVYGVFRVASFRGNECFQRWLPDSFRRWGQHVDQTRKETRFSNCLPSGWHLWLSEETPPGRSGKLSREGREKEAERDEGEGNGGEEEKERGEREGRRGKGEDRGRLKEGRKRGGWGREGEERGWIKKRRMGREKREEGRQEEKKGRGKEEKRGKEKVFVSLSIINPRTIGLADLFSELGAAPPTASLQGLFHMLPSEQEGNCS